MIREITPAESLRNSVLITSERILGYGLALTSSAVVVGAGAGLVGDYFRSIMNYGLIENIWIGGLSVIVIAYGFRELGLIRLPMPQLHWQVPVNWSRFGKMGQSIAYGYVLGADIFTFIPYGTFYIILLLEASIGFHGGALIGLVYGFSRTISVIVAASIHYLKPGKEINQLAIDILQSHIFFHNINGISLLTIGGLLLIQTFQYLSI